MGFTLYHMICNIYVPMWANYQCYFTNQQLQLLLRFELKVVCEMIMVPVLDKIFAKLRGQDTDQDILFLCTLWYTLCLNSVINSLKSANFC